MEQCKKEGWVDKMKEQTGEGCNLHGLVKVKKMAGIFKITFGRTISIFGMQLHAVFGSTNHDFSHTINHLSFGDDVPSVVNPLNGLVKKRAKGNFD